jgi:hypothetical protein
MDEILEKSGQDLFKEIVRIYETAAYEDYFKAGQWKNDLMKTDYVLLAAHRKEAGAPDPPALEDVKLPEGIEKATASKVLPGATATAAMVGGGPVAELRLIALFVAKWKLDPTKTKAMVAKLQPGQRRYVIQNFKATATGDAGVTELEKFIEECKTNGAWDKMLSTPAVTPVTSVTAVRPPLIGVTPAAVKRPVGAIFGSAVADANKKLRPTTPTPATSPATTLAAKLAAARAQSGGGIVKVMPKVAGAKAPAVSGLRPTFPQKTALVTPVRPIGVQKAATPTQPAQPKGALIRNLLKKF